ncbi:MAG: hypothetical protein ABIF77_04765 [bacterium]
MPISSRSFEIILLMYLFVPCTGWACSCDLADTGFLFPSGIEVPANIGGIPWFGIVEERFGVIESPPKGAFSVEIHIGNEWQPVEFEYWKQFSPRSPSADFQMDMLLVRPQEGFVPGTRYRFNFEATGHSIRPFGSETDMRRQSIDLFVSQDKLTGSSDPTILKISKQKYGFVRIASGGSCSQEIESAYRMMKLFLPDEILRWSDSVLYFCWIDEHWAWRPSHYLCSIVPPGKSWMGPGQEVVFIACGSHYRMRFELTRGEHTIRMEAVLPGTDISFQDSGSFSLDCGDTMRRYRSGLESETQSDQ